MPIAEKHYHAVQFYKDEGSLAETVARFLADGLNIGEPAIIVATPSHTAAVKERLEALGLNPRELRRTGELKFLDASKLLSAFMVNGVPDPFLFKRNVSVVDAVRSSPITASFRIGDALVDAAAG